MGIFLRMWIEIISRCRLMASVLGLFYTDLKNVYPTYFASLITV